MTTVVAISNKSRDVHRTATRLLDRELERPLYDEGIIAAEGLSPRRLRDQVAGPTDQRGGSMACIRQKDQALR